MYQSIILGVIRHLLTAAGGAAVAAGYATTDETTGIIGGLTALVGVIWSVIEKSKR